MTIPDIKNALLPVFKEYGVSRAVLFGSYAKGCATDKSDIDILVDSGLRGLAFTGFLEDIFVRLNKPVDVIDVAHIDRESKIGKDIQQTGVVIWDIIANDLPDLQNSLKEL
jgi:hypothetical protein